VFRPALRGSAYIVVALLTFGCGNGLLGPSIDPQVTNQTDDFQFQAINLTEATDTYTYSWVNTGTTASVNHSGGVSGGTATLIVRDASGTQRYSGDLKTGGTFTTASGTSGTWQIEVRLDDVAGFVSFRVQRGS
jgi:hypothetical protein